MQVLLLFTNKAWIWELFITIRVTNAGGFPTYETRKFSIITPGGLFCAKKPENLYNRFGAPSVNLIGWVAGDRPGNGIWSYARFLEDCRAITGIITSNPLIEDYKIIVACHN